ncbi:hypothetical protein DMENIID0001_144810 [Sergentomyia squamirostris]
MDVENIERAEASPVACLLADFDEVNRKSEELENHFALIDRKLLEAYVSRFMKELALQENLIPQDEEMISDHEYHAIRESLKKELLISSANWNSHQVDIGKFYKKYDIYMTD